MARQYSIEDGNGESLAHFDTTENVDAWLNVHQHEHSGIRIKEYDGMTMWANDYPCATYPLQYWQERNLPKEERTPYVPKPRSLNDTFHIVSSDPNFKRAVHNSISQQGGPKMSKSINDIRTVADAEDYNAWRRIGGDCMKPSMAITRSTRPSG